MVLSIGVYYSKDNWKTCLLENGHALELRLFNDARAIVEYMQHTCAIFPELIITLATNSDVRLTPEHTFPAEQRPEQMLQSDLRQDEDELNSVLLAIRSINCHTFMLPSINQLPGVPVFRRHYRLDMGGSDMLCATAMLLFRMRMQEAAWQEMRFLYLNAGDNARNIVVVEDGRIVNAIGGTSATYRSVGATVDRNGLDGTGGHDNWSDHLEQKTMAELAYWEGLTQDLAGLLAIHHLEDIVVTGQRKEAVIERLEDRYRFYLFPHSEDEEIGFEAAIGAAIIAEGLYRPGLAAEVVDRLLITHESLRR